MSRTRTSKTETGLTREKVEVYSLFGDFITKSVIAGVLIILFIAVLIVICVNVSNGTCDQVWWLTLVNVTLGFGLRTMFKHYFK